MSQRQRHRLFFNRQAMPAFDALIAQIHSQKETEFASAARSTVPLFAFVKDGTCILESLLADMGLDPNPDFHFEFQVEPQRGRGKPSHTDLMARSHSAVVAIEAKYTEPPYEDVNVWLKGGENPHNRVAVLQGWIDMIQPWTVKPIRIEDLGGVTYQTIHRAASACAVATESGTAKPRLTYLHFRLAGAASSEASHYEAGLEKVFHLIGRPSDFPFFLHEIEITPTPAYERIVGLVKGQASTSERVRQALLNEKLFEYGFVSSRRWCSFR